jgi:hypothetical protein
MRLPTPLLVAPFCLLVLASCSNDGGSCAGETCAAPPDDTDPDGADPDDADAEDTNPDDTDPDDASRACQQLRTCCDQLPAEYEGELGEVYRSRCLDKLDDAEASRDPSPAASCAQLVQSLADWYFCFVPEDDAPEASCEGLIACAEQVAPDTLPMLLETYGPDGACWTSTEDIQQACLDSCTQALDAYRDAGQCRSDGEDTETYNYPDWLIYEDAIVAYCTHEVMCEGGPDTEADPIGLRRRECDDRVKRWVHYGPPPCDEKVRAELACRLERGCDTETWCGPELDEACTPPEG